MLLELLIGLTIDDAFDLCKKNGFRFRITREDSNYFIVTMDFCNDRVNVEVDGGMVTKCDIY